MPRVYVASLFPSCSALGFLLVAGCAGGGLKVARLDEPVLAPPELPVVDASAGAVVLLDEAVLRFVSPERPREGYELSSFYRFQVRSEGARVQAALLSFTLEPWEEVLEVSARSYAPGRPETVVDVGPRDLAYRSPTSDSVLMYRDFRVLDVNVPRVDVGDIVEYRIRARQRQVFQLDRWSFSGPWPVVRSRIQVEVPEGWRLGWTYYERGRRAPFEPIVTAHDRGHRLDFELRDVSPMRWAPQSVVSLDSRRLRLAVVEGPGRPGEDTFSDWDALGRWYRAFLQENVRLAESDWSVVRAAVGDDTSPPSLYAFVRDRIRYVALYEDKLGGFKPHAAGAVLRAGHGDCKDMSTLLVSLLRRAGHEAHPMLVGVGMSRFFDESVASIDAFNHAVVALPLPGGGYRFLDPTDKEGAFDILPPHLQGEGGLVVRPTDVELLRVPRAPAETNRSEVIYQLQGSDRVRIRATLRGYAAAGLMWLREHHPDRLRQRLEEQYLSRLVIRSRPELSVARRDGGVVVEGWVDVEPVSRRAMGVEVLPLEPFLPERLLADPVEPRVADVDLPRAGVWEVTVEIPTQGRRILERPGPTEVVAGSLAHSLSSELHEGRVVVQTRLRVDETRLSGPGLEALRRVDHALASALRSAVVLEGRAQ